MDPGGGEGTVSSELAHFAAYSVYAAGKRLCGVESSRYAITQYVPGGTLRLYVPGPVGGQVGPGGVDESGLPKRGVLVSTRRPVPQS